MVALAALVALAVAVGAAVMTAVGHRAADGGATRLVAALVGSVVLVLVLAGVLGGGILGTDGPGDDATAPSATRQPPEPVRLRHQTVRLFAAPPGSLPPPLRAVGGLENGAVVVLGITGLEPRSTATVHQCPTGAVDARPCRPGLPVTMSDPGSATVLVDLEDRFTAAWGEAEEVECTGTACSIVVFGSSRLEVVTVFGGPPPLPVTVAAQPAAVPPGGTVTATAERLVPGTPVAFAVCRPHEGGTDCGDPTPAVIADREGRATAPVPVGAGRCARGSTCAVAVIVDDGGPRAYASLSLVGRDGVLYADGRVRIGLLVAALLLIAGLVLLWRTDWTPVDGDPFAAIVLPDDPFADDRAP